jgi:hypothetical protein
VGLEPLAVKGYYVGRRVIRSYRGQVYIHIPAKIVNALGVERSRRVKATMILNTEVCQSRAFHGIMIRFVGMLVVSGRFGSSYRLTIPSNYGWILSKLAGCAKVDVWLEPVVGEHVEQPRKKVEVQVAPVFEEGEE